MMLSKRSAIASLNQVGFCTRLVTIALTRAKRGVVEPTNGENHAGSGTYKLAASRVGSTSSLILQSGQMTVFNYLQAL